MLHMSERDQQRRLGPSLGPFNKLKTVWSQTAKRLKNDKTVGIQY